MNKVIAALAAGMFTIAGASVYAADQPVQTMPEASAKEPGPQNDPASPEKKHKSGKKTVKAQGGPCAPGAGDPSAAAKGKPQGGDVKCNPEESAKKPGNK